MKALLSYIGHQGWIRYGIRDRIIRFFHDPDASKNEPFECPFFGKIYPGNFNTFLDWCVFYYGAYAKEELLCMRDFLETIDDPVMVDVGANVGHHTLFASTVASHVHSFEPYAPVAEKLSDKLNRNQVQNVNIHRVGLGESKELLSYSPPLTNNSGTGSFCGKNVGRETIELEVCVADEYFESAGISKIDFLKMDIEGFEVSALKGMEQSLRRLRPVCFFEWTQLKRDGEVRCGKDLFPADYAFYKLIANEPFSVFFNRDGYRLQALGEDWPDGNLLAVPTEYAERVNSLNPLPRVALRLRGQ